MACQSCNGEGKKSYRIAGNSTPINVGNGVVVEDLGGWGTEACACVRDLPAIHGRATWWEIETIYSKTVGIPIGNEEAIVKADGEVPRDEDGHRLHRTRENAYYPPLVELEMQRSATLHADTARELAAALNAAADACDAYDALTQELSA